SARLAKSIWDCALERAERMAITSCARSTKRSGCTTACACKLNAAAESEFGATLQESPKTISTHAIKRQNVCWRPSESRDESRLRLKNVCRYRADWAEPPRMRWLQCRRYSMS